MKYICPGVLGTGVFVRGLSSGLCPDTPLPNYCQFGPVISEILAHKVRKSWITTVTCHSESHFLKT